MKSWLDKSPPSQAKTSVFNQKVIEGIKKISGALGTILSDDSVDDAEVNKLNYPAKLLNSIPGAVLLPNHTLALKIEYFLMILCNSQPKNRHINGIRYIVDSMIIDELFLQIATRRIKAAYVWSHGYQMSLAMTTFSGPGLE